MIMKGVRLLIKGILIFIGAILFLVCGVFTSGVADVLSGWLEENHPNVYLLCKVAFWIGAIIVLIVYCYL